MSILKKAIKNDIIIEDLEESDLMKLVGFQEKYRDYDMLFEVFN